MGKLSGVAVIDKEEVVIKRITKTLKKGKEVTLQGRANARRVIRNFHLSVDGHRVYDRREVTLEQKNFQASKLNWTLVMKFNKKLLIGA